MSDPKDSMTCGFFVAKNTNKTDDITPENNPERVTKRNALCLENPIP